MIHRGGRDGKRWDRQVEGHRKRGRERGKTEREGETAREWENRWMGQREKDTQ
jgi:hypothetical protein